ncbi:MAG TPA: methyltransferase domain-containing protein, partial [Mycobacterium sp.]|nr:methyltransferase domain-containing protein [Mycobacterium sp.]
RAAGERELSAYPRLRSIDGTAEATTLAPHSVDFIVAGQAFHWFDRERARTEFLRILRPDGCVALVWNERETRATPFLRDYEALLERYATDYASIDHKRLTPGILGKFFGPAGRRLATFPNRQLFDLAGLRGRLLSSSYTPEAGHPVHEPMLTDLERISAAHAGNGRVAFEYTTRMHYGWLG